MRELVDVAYPAAEQIQVESGHLSIPSMGRCARPFRPGSTTGAALLCVPLRSQARQLDQYSADRRLAPCTASVWIGALLSGTALSGHLPPGRDSAMSQRREGLGQEDVH